MKKIIKLTLLIYLQINIFNCSFGNENFFNKGLELYNDKKYEDARFMFERSLVFNPKDSNSYLYLAKIYNIVIAYASDNPSKKHRENLVFRSLLLKTLIDDFKMTKIFFDQDLSSPWAIKTIKKCKKKYDIKQLDFVIGSDLLKEISSWKNIIII